MEGSYSCLNNMNGGKQFKVGIAGYGIVGEKGKNTLTKMRQWR